MRFLSVWAVVALLLPALAEAQGPPRVQPAEVGADPRGGTKQPLRCYIHVRGAVATPASGQPRPLEFMEQFFVADVFPRSEKPTHVYLVLPITKSNLKVREQIGWAPVENCLLFHGNGPTALRDPETFITRKAMLVTYLRDAGATTSRPTDNSLKDDLLRQQTAFFDRPAETGAGELSRRGLFEIYYVYDETATHLFLGDKPRVEMESTRKDILLGWVPKKRLCLWNTREAVEFNKLEISRRTQPALVFNSDQELDRFLSAIRPPNLAALQARQPSVLSAWEDLENHKVWPYDLPRYPVLREMRSDDWPHNTAYEVGIIGHLYGSNKQVLLTGAELDELKKRADVLIAGVSNVQVSILIDGTISMKDWIEPVKTAVKQIFDKVRNEYQDATMTCAIHFYRSETEKQYMVETNPFGGEVEAIAILEKHNIFGGGDKQQMFQAILETLRLRPFQPEATKILVVIGDAGSVTSRDGLGADQVAKELIAGGSKTKQITGAKKGYAFPVNFFAISVGDAPEKFEQQTSRIAKLVADNDLQETLRRLPADNQEMNEARAALLKAAHAQRQKVLVSRDSKEVIQSILQNFQLAVDELRYIRKELDELRKGTTTVKNIANGNDPGSKPDAGPYGLIWQQRTEALLDANNLQDLKKAKQGVQLFEVGWIFEKHPEEVVPRGAQSEPFAIRHMAFMHRSEVISLKQFLHSLQTRFAASGRDEKTEKAWEEALRKITGDEDVDGKLTPSELARRHLGIKSRTGLLSFTYEEVGQLTPEKKAEIQIKLLKCANQLGDLELEQSADYTVVPPAKGEFDPRLDRTSKGSQKVWWPESERLSSRDPRGWIDRNYLP